MNLQPSNPPLFPYTTLFRSVLLRSLVGAQIGLHCWYASSEGRMLVRARDGAAERAAPSPRSEEHTSELQSLAYLVCRLLLEKKKKLLMTLSLNLTNLPVTKY